MAEDLGSSLKHAFGRTCEPWFFEGEVAPCLYLMRKLSTPPVAANLRVPPAPTYCSWPCQLSCQGQQNRRVVVVDPRCLAYLAIGGTRRGLLIRWYPVVADKIPNHPASPAALRKIRIRGGSLRPSPVRTRLGLRRQADFYVQRMVKYHHRCEFHSLAELYHAALLEGDPTVNYYVPQPFALTVNGTPYVPDIYFIRNGVQHVGELKPRGEFKEALRQPLEAFFKHHGMTFVVIDNAAVFEREVAAQNWIVIIQNLLTLEHLQTQDAEWDIIEELQGGKSLAFSEFIDVGNRAATELREAAIYRLLHRAKITANLEQEFWGLETEVQLCI